MTSAFDAQNSTELNNTFKTLAQNLAGHLSASGIKTRAYIEGTPHFNALSQERKIEAIQHLQFYFDLCSAHVFEGMSLRDTQTFTWRAFKACGLTPNSDLLSLISAGDIIEIYSLNNVQIFRNLEFFEFCSYTLEELYCLEWWRLFSRSELVTQLMMKCAGEVFAGKHPGGMLNPVPSHTMNEIASSQMFQLTVSFKYIGPLYTNKVIKALVCVESGGFSKAAGPS